MSAKKNKRHAVTLMIQHTSKIKRQEYENLKKYNNTMAGCIKTELRQEGCYQKSYDKIKIYKDI